MNIEEIYSLNRKLNEFEENYRQALEENQELKKQLENCYCNRTDCSSRIRNSKQYDSLVQKTEKQQKEFIAYLENEISEFKKISVRDLEAALVKESHIKLMEEILSKYKEIRGGNNGN